ncbi:hypothetical protein AQPE_4986 [Aquipluma nitroreducens]|uniref:Uncharacterized protein n=1 Tax=Aquipluma nitroreducens TaxID=2010828 RepID=A0A5K7SGP1_9BACT|nr:hypothetical protein AQPE_4986 [Aquipluma nitroreducens]
MPVEISKIPVKSSISFQVIRPEIVDKRGLKLSIQHILLLLRVIRKFINQIL